MWPTHTDCKKIAQNSWLIHTQGSRAYNLQQKIKSIRGKFIRWNGIEFGKVEKELKEKQRKLQEVQNSISNTTDIRVERYLRSEIEKLMAQEEFMWA